ncbi:MAG: rubrerythrin [Thiobacillus sp. 65-69]|nr:rubrerythrin family protein [Thiobacillus sp.]ODU87774.1 MAG: rubrerythrin [Thiobacillus sp. SCN 65-179]OJW39436.1 MAG: rubrerythrin [Thiobacillus sp. 65-69]
MQNASSVTIQNLEAAFAGESMAHIKYLWFARQCRKLGDEATARVFEDTAAQEILHAFGHAELLFADETMTPEKCLQYAIEGETHEYTEMYPKFRHEAMQEGNAAAVAELDEQIVESKAHAEMFKAVLDKAAKRFAALARVEEKHAKHYRAARDALAAPDALAA